MGIEGYSAHEQRDNSEHNLSRLDYLLAKLIETGAELDPYHRAQIRSYIKQLFWSLGIKDMSAEKLLEVRQRLNAKQEYYPTPPKYPSKSDFQKKLLKIVMSEQASNLPEIPDEIKASDLAINAQYDWLTIQGRGVEYTLDYLYDLGKLMMVKGAYQALFPDEDNIIVGDSWRIENGPQRALVIKTLGPKFIRDQGIDDWINVDRPQK